MKKRAKHYLLTLMLAACALLLPARALGCECVGHSVASAKKASRAVFVGRVLGVDGEGRVRLAVEKLWKGGDVAEFVVASAYGLCSAGFEVGESYLVYAYWDEGGNRLATDICIRTRPVGMTEDLKKLGRPKVIRSVRNVNQ